MTNTATTPQQGNLHLNFYSSIVPSEMTNRELRHMCTELQIARNHGAENARVRLPNGCTYLVPVSNLADYQEAHRTEFNS